MLVFFQELREKNWKVIDALDAAQKDLSEHKKSTNIRIIKGLKNIVPDFSIPKFEDNYEMLFKEFGEKVSTTFQASEPTESAELAEQVKTLTDENVELKKTNEIMVSFLNRNGPGYQQHCGVGQSTLQNQAHHSLL